MEEGGKGTFCKPNVILKISNLLLENYLYTVRE